MHCRVWLLAVCGVTGDFAARDLYWVKWRNPPSSGHRMTFRHAFSRVAFQPQRHVTSSSRMSLFHVNHPSRRGWWHSQRRWWTAQFSIRVRRRTSLSVHNFPATLNPTMSPPPIFDRTPLRTHLLPMASHAQDTTKTQMVTDVSRETPAPPNWPYPQSPRVQPDIAPDP